MGSAEQATPEAAGGLLDRRRIALFAFADRRMTIHNAIVGSVELARLSIAEHKPVSHRVASGQISALDRPHPSFNER